MRCNIRVSLRSVRLKGHGHMVSFGSKLGLAALRLAPKLKSVTGKEYNLQCRVDFRVITAVPLVFTTL